MKKFDCFTVLSAIAITENTILMIAQGGWFTFAGLIFGGIFALVAYWDWKRYQIIKSDSQTRNDIQAMSEAFRLIGRTGITIDEFSAALNSACQEPHSIGDVGCKWNARSPHLRCAINPDGPFEVLTVLKHR